MARDDDLRQMPEADRAMFARDRDRMDAAIAAAEERFDILNLVGASTKEARLRVESVGGEFVDDSRPVAAKFDVNRVVVTIRAQRVVSARIG